MRILLTGASGLLGAHTLRYLLGLTDHEVVCPVTFRHKGMPERIAWATGDSFGHHPRLTLVHHDLASPVSESAERAFGDVDIILNLASDTHPPRSVLHPVEFVHNNIDITLYLLEYARHRPRSPLFIQISTDSVYGPAITGTHREWDPIVPNNPYSASKAAQEALAIAYWRSYRLPVVIAATMNPIGETQDTEKFIPMTIKNVLAGNIVKLHANAAGEVGMRTYIDAGDVASALVYLAGEPAAMHDGEITRPDRWNIVGPHEIDNLKVARIIAGAIGRPLDYELVAVDRPEHGHRYSMSGEKLLALGDWRPRHDTGHSISRIAEWTAKHPEWVL